MVFQNLNNFWKGVISVAGGFIIELVLGSFYLWGAINLYVNSYYFNLDPSNRLSPGFTLVVFPLMSLFSHSASPFGIKLADKIGLRPLIFICTIWLFSAVFLSSFMPNFWYFLIFYAMLFGIPVGLLYLPPLYNSFQYFPEKKALISGIIMGGYGLGSTFSTLLVMKIINPHNIPPSVIVDGKKYFDHSISENVPSALRYLALFFLCMCSIGGLLIIPKKEENNEEDFVDIDNNEQFNLKRRLLQDSRSVEWEKSKSVSSSHQRPSALSAASHHNPIHGHRLKHHIHLTHHNLEKPYIRPSSLKDGSNFNKFSSDPPGATNEMGEIKQEKEERLEEEFPIDSKLKTMELVVSLPSKRYPDVINALKSKKFIQMFLMMFCSASYGYLISANFKNYGVTFPNVNDHFLNFVGSVGAICNGGSRLFWGIINQKFPFRGLYFTILLIQIFLNSTLSSVADNNAAYMTWVCMSLAMEGSHFVIFPALCAKVFGTNTGTRAYGFLFFSCFLANLGQFLIVTFLEPVMGYSNLFWIFVFGSCVSFVINLFFRDNHD